eukprot:11576065-Alexandrium_andersonii.AAC.1
MRTQVLVLQHARELGDPSESAQPWTQSLCLSTQHPAAPVTLDTEGAQPRLFPGFEHVAVVDYGSAQP